MRDYALFQAIRNNDRNLFNAYIDEADINQINENGQNLLHEAIVSQNSLIAEELIYRKINVNQGDKNLQTPLHYCAMHDNADIARLILLHGGHLNLSDNFGNQPLWIAVFNAKGRYNIVNVFMQYNPDIHHKNNNNKSPLDFAKQINDQTLVSILFSNKSA